MCRDYLAVSAAEFSAPGADCRRRDVLRSLHLDITHAGLAGIQAVDAFLDLIDMGRHRCTRFLKNLPIIQLLFSMPIDFAVDPDLQYFSLS
jgi:hypothetical protein